MSAGNEECFECGSYGHATGDCPDLPVNQAALKADAERLAELKREHDTLRLPVVELGIRPPRETTDRIRSLQALIAVYEECAARGIAFGGVR